MLAASDLIDTLSLNLGVPRVRVAAYAAVLSLSEPDDVMPPDALRLLIALISAPTAEEALEAASIQGCNKASMIRHTILPTERRIR